MIIDITQHVAFLAAATVLLQVLAQRLPPASRGYTLVIGLVFGGIGVYSMMNPAEYMPGIIYDARSVSVGLAGFAGGPLAALVASVLSGGYRVYLGGAGAPVGVASVLEAAVIGAIYFQLRRRDDRWNHPAYIWLCGVAIHVAVVGSQLLLPDGRGFFIVREIGLSMIIYYPITFLIVALIILNGEGRQRAELMVAGQRRVLQMLATGATLEQIMARLVDHLQQLTPDIRAAILVKDADQARLAAAPNLPAALAPPFINNETDGPLQMARSQGNPMIIPDLAADGRWPALAEAARQQGLRACWIYPIQSLEDDCLGGLALYRQYPGTPDRLHTSVIEQAIRTAAIVITHRGQEENLRRERDFATQIMETMGQGLAVVNTDGKLTYVNPALAQMLGYPDPESLHGRESISFATSDSQDAMHKAVEDREMGRRSSYTINLRRQDGSEFPVLVTGVPQMQDGQLSRTIAVLTDITEREQQGRERALIANLSRALRTAITREEIVPILLAELTQQLRVDGAALEILDPESGDWRLEYASGIWDAVVGLTTPANQGVNPKILAHGHSYLSNDLAAEPDLIHREAFGDCRAGAGVPIVIDEAIHNILWIGSRHPLSAEDLSLLEAVADMASGALQRADLYEATRNQAQQMRQIMDSVPQGIVLLDGNDCVLIANQPALHYLSILGYTETEQPLIQLDNRNLSHFKQPTANGLWHEIEVGNYIFAIDTTQILGNLGPSQWILLIDDITEERRTQTQLQLQERLATVGQFAAGIAHDFNNIMGVIVLQVQMAARSPNLTDREKQRLMVVHDQAMHATNLIRQILDFSRRSMMERQPIDLLPLIKEQTKLLGRILPESITVSLAYDTGPFLIQADPTRLQQVLMNLSINARDAMPDGGQLTIHIGRQSFGPEDRLPCPEMRPGEWIALAVTDTGMGIEADDLPRIFEPFFTTKAPGSGSGMGLAQVHGILAQHQGAIAVQSRVGKGSRFTVYLPSLEEASPAPDALPPLEEPAGQGRTILLVEDNATLRLVLGETLSMWDYTVVNATNGAEALSLVQEYMAQGSPIHLVLSDVVMPVMGGLALVKELHAQGWNLPVILMSGNTSEQGMEDLRKMNVRAWLPKPPTPERLAAALAQHTSESAPI